MLNCAEISTRPKKLVFPLETERHWKFLFVYQPTFSLLCPQEDNTRNKILQHHDTGMLIYLDVRMANVERSDMVVGVWL